MDNMENLSEKFINAHKNVFDFVKNAKIPKMKDVDMLKPSDMLLVDIYNKLESAEMKNKYLYLKTFLITLTSGIISGIIVGLILHYL